MARPMGSDEADGGEGSSGEFSRGGSANGGGRYESEYTAVLAGRSIRDPGARPSLAFVRKAMLSMGTEDVFF